MTVVHPSFARLAGRFAECRTNGAPAHLPALGQLQGTLGSEHAFESYPEYSKRKRRTVDLSSDVICR